jgi:hypothetical protein
VQFVALEHQFRVGDAKVLLDQLQLLLDQLPPSHLPVPVALKSNHAKQDVLAHILADAQVHNAGDVVAVLAASDSCHNELPSQTDASLASDQRTRADLPVPSTEPGQTAQHDLHP